MALFSFVDLIESGNHALLATGNFSQLAIKVPANFGGNPNLLQLGSPVLAKIEPLLRSIKMTKLSVFQILERVSYETYLVTGIAHYSHSDLQVVSVATLDTTFATAFIVYAAIKLTGRPIGILVKAISKIVHAIIRWFKW